MGATIRRRSDRAGNASRLDRRTQQQLDQLLAKLPGMERRILQLRFGLTGGHPTSRSDIADRLDLTAREVAEIEKRGLEHLRQTVPDVTVTRMLHRLSG